LLAYVNDLRVDSPERDERMLNRAIMQARDGDRDALRYLYVRYADKVYGHVRGYIRDDSEAEDVTQQVFAKLIGALTKYEPREVPFSAWILRVAHNVAIDTIRRRRAVPVEDVRVADTGDSELAHDRALALREALQALPLDQREVLVLRHVVGLTPCEIAERLGKTESSIHGLHHRGRGALKRALTANDAAPSTCRA
jgi:RNA polymerase sigma-70 factor (ECF subfamily)